MNKNIILLAIIIFLGIHTYRILHQDTVQPVPAKPIVINPENKNPIDYILPEDVKKYVETLASAEFCGRGTGSTGNTKAATYIKTYLDSLNIPYKEQAFTVRGKQASNIIAYIEPTHKKSDKIIVIGAHYDHLGGTNINSYYPGADDNGSGVAGLMAIAMSLSHYKDKLNHTVLLQFYSAEELGLMGSKYYVDHPLFPQDKPDISQHIAMINLDMIGYLKDKYSEHENVTKYRDYNEWIVFNYSDSLSLKNIVTELSDKYIFAKNISGYRPGGSDHAPFYNKGIPVVFLHTGLHSHYHKMSDTPDRLNYPGLAKVSQLALEILIEIDKQIN